MFNDTHISRNSTLIPGPQKTIDIALGNDFIARYLPNHAIDSSSWSRSFNDQIHMFRFQLLNLIDTMVGDNTNCKIRIPDFHMDVLEERITTCIDQEMSIEEQNNLFSQTSKKVNGIIQDVLAMYPGLFVMAA